MNAMSLGESNTKGKHQQQQFLQSSQHVNHLILERHKYKTKGALEQTEQTKFPTNL